MTSHGTKPTADSAQANLTESMDGCRADSCISTQRIAFDRGAEDTVCSLLVIVPIADVKGFGKELIIVNIVEKRPYRLTVLRTRSG